MKKQVVSAALGDRAKGWLLASLLVAIVGCNEQSAGPEQQQASAQLQEGRLSYSADDFVAKQVGRTGGVLRATSALDTNTLNIHSIAHGNVQWLGRLLFDGLVYQDADGNATPWLASSWTVSEDGKTYTFKLREDVTFSDGTPFNAEAVLINFEHMRDPATKSPLAAAYIWPYEKGRVIDEFTFEAQLKHPYKAFLDVLAQSWLSMLSPKQIKEDPKSLAERPIGTGPFVLESYTRAQGLSVKRRPDYNWAPAVINHQGPAYLERIELDFVPESLVRYSTLLSGEYQFTFDAPPQNASAIRSNSELEFHSRVRKGNPFRSLTFNTERAPFDDVRLRKALTIGIDQEALAWISGFGEYLVKHDFLAANTHHYDPLNSQVLAYNPEEANRLLDEAGWIERDADGIRLRDGQRLSAELTMSENPAFPSSVAVALQADARKLGVDIQLKVLPLLELGELRYAGDFQLLGGGYWHTNTPDGLFILYHSQSIPSATLIGQNVGRLRDEKLDQLLTQARQSQDPEQLKSLYAQAQQRLVELVPAAPTVESHHLSAFSKRLKGVIFDTSHNTPLLTAAWLEGDES